MAEGKLASQPHAAARRLCAVAPLTQHPATPPAQLDRRRSSGPPARRSTRLLDRRRAHGIVGIMLLFLADLVASAQDHQEMEVAFPATDAGRDRSLHPNDLTTVEGSPNFTMGVAPSLSLSSLVASLPAASFTPFAPDTPPCLSHPWMLAPKDRSSSATWGAPLREPAVHPLEARTKLLDILSSRAALN